MKLFRFLIFLFVVAVVIYGLPRTMEWLDGLSPEALIAPIALLCGASAIIIFVASIIVIKMESKKKTDLKDMDLMPRLKEQEVNRFRHESGRD